MGTPAWLIVIQALCFGFYSWPQYINMNTLMDADITKPESSSASSAASTMQEMSLIFGVATASLVVALFIPDLFHVSAQQMPHGIRRALRPRRDNRVVHCRFSKRRAIFQHSA
jgi:hypothetical protein